ncbi:glycosyltransferase family 4 protein [Rhizoctonia solani]|uniref:Glycosyltransferase family 4 protein n=1 Tax=Rhizoctonia solani TaxID=456999 RepID=A0A8H8NWK5_9AGAM|nr:glycosyltransferase family 4 protein [Rhizoctonia solani]QRW19701.1 glycosyltransferase family 4 protein [Rhizoctonia solani]
MLRERVQFVHGHASLSSLAHEGLLHSHHLGIRTVFTDHSLFSLDDATGILTNKLLAGALKSVDAIIGVSHTGRENTMLRANAVVEVLQNPADPRFFVVPNAILPEQFQPGPVTQRDLKKQITIVVISRLAYRKGVDLLVAAAPRICAQFPQVHFVIGGDGPKLTNLLQMRERHMLQDRIHLLGSLRHDQVHETLLKGDIYLNTSLTESFGIGLLEAACTGLYVVSTRVGGVPEVLPQDMISFAMPEEDDVTRALGEAIAIVTKGKHNPQKAHERIKSMYSWTDVAQRTNEIYNWVATKEPLSFWERLCRTYDLGMFAGPIYVIILVVDCFFFAFLEWWLPRDQLDVLSDEDEWDASRFARLFHPPRPSSLKQAENNPRLTSIRVRTYPLDLAVYGHSASTTPHLLPTITWGKNNTPHDDGDAYDPPPNSRALGLYPRHHTRLSSYSSPSPKADVRNFHATRGYRGDSMMSSFGPALSSGHRRRTVPRAGSRSGMR